MNIFASLSLWQLYWSERDVYSYSATASQAELQQAEM